MILKLLKGLAQAKIIKKSVILFRVLNMYERNCFGGALKKGNFIILIKKKLGKTKKTGYIVDS